MIEKTLNISNLHLKFVSIFPFPIFVKILTTRQKVLAWGIAVSSNKIIYIKKITNERSKTN